MDISSIVVIVVIVVIGLIVVQRIAQARRGEDDFMHGTPQAQPKAQAQPKVNWTSSPIPQRPAQPIDWAAINDPSVQQYLPNRKIDAIKAYRQLTNQGLKESKDAIEYAIAHPQAVGKNTKDVIVPPVLSDAGVRDLLEAGKFEDAVEAYKNFAGVDYFSARNAVEGIQSEMQRGAASGISTEEILDLLSAGKKIEAIKRYREATGLGLKEAKDAVEDIERLGRR